MSPKGRLGAVVVTVAVVAVIAVRSTLWDGGTGAPTSPEAVEAPRVMPEAVGPRVEEAAAPVTERTERAPATVTDLMLVGRVVERGTEARLAGVPIQGSRIGGERVVVAESDSRGEFEIVELTAGDWIVEAGRTDRHAFIGEPVTVALREDASPPEVVLRVMRQWFLGGVVVETGTARPVPAVALAARTGTDRKGIATSGADGRFRSRGSFPEGWLTIYHQSHGLHRGGPEQLDLLRVEVGTDDVANLRVEFPWPGGLVGRVVDSRARPIAAALVRVFTPGAIELKSPATRGFALYPSLRTEGVWVRTDEFGSFRLRSLPEDRRLQLVASAPGFASNTSRILDPPFREGDPPIEIRLERGGAIFGKVLTAEGEPFAEVTVLPSPIEELAYLPDPTRTADDGTFACEGLPPGPYSIVAQVFQRGGRHEIVAGLDVEVEAGRRTEVVLRAGVSEIALSGVVVDADGAPVNGLDDGLRVRAGRVVVPGGRYEPPKEVQVGVDGRFELPGLSKTRYRLYALSGAAGDPYDPIEVDAPNEDLRLTWAPPPRCELLLRSVDANSREPIPMVQLSLTHVEDGRGRMSLGTNTGPDGTRRLAVREGTYRVVGSKAGHAPCVLTVDTLGRGGSVVDLDLALVVGRRVTGVVIDANGQVVPGASVAVILDEGGPVYSTAVQAGPDGRFVQQSAPPSGGSLCVVAPDYSWTAVTRIVEGETVLALSEEPSPVEKDVGGER